MNRTLVVLITGCLVLFTFTAQAAKRSQNIEFSDISCTQFIQGLAEMDEDGAAYVMMWLDGYLSGVSGDTELNWNSLERIGNNLVDYCAEHGDTEVLEAAKEVGIQ